MGTDSILITLSVRQERSSQNIGRISVHHSYTFTQPFTTMGILASQWEETREPIGNIRKQNLGKIQPKTEHFNDLLEHQTWSTQDMSHTH